jgi:hypothetical protein
MHGPINVKSHNNNSKWQMGFNSAFNGLICVVWLAEPPKNVADSVAALNTACMSSFKAWTFNTVNFVIGRGHLSSF